MIYEPLNSPEQKERNRQEMYLDEFEDAEISQSIMVISESASIIFENKSKVHKTGMKSFRMSN